MTWIGWLKLTAVTLVVLVLAMFVAQNMGRSTTLSIDLYFVAWRLSSPVAIPVLMGLCLGFGAVVAGGWGRLRTRAAVREAERLRDELAVARARASSPAGDWAKRPPANPA